MCPVEYFCCRTKVKPNFLFLWTFLAIYTYQLKSNFKYIQTALCTRTVITFHEKLFYALYWIKLKVFCFQLQPWNYGIDLSRRFLKLWYLAYFWIGFVQISRSFVTFQRHSSIIKKTTFGNELLTLYKFQWLLFSDKSPESLKLQSLFKWIWMLETFLTRKERREKLKPNQIWLWNTNAHCNGKFQRLSRSQVQNCW